MASSLHAWSNVGSCVCWNSCRNAWKWGVGDGKRPCKFIYIVNLSKEMWICFFKAFTAYHLNKHKVWLHTWKALCPGGLCHASNRRLHATLGSMWGWFFQLHPSICQRSSHDCGLLVFCRFMTPLFCSHPAALCHPSIHPPSCPDPKVHLQLLTSSTVDSIGGVLSAKKQQKTTIMI